MGREIIVLGIFCLLLFGCYGPFVSEAHVDKTSAASLQQTVKLYQPSELVGLDYHSLGEVTATSCKNMIWDPSPSKTDAITQLQFKAFTVRATGLILWGCDSYGTQLSTNCWSSVVCKATMIYINPSNTTE